MAHTGLISKRFLILVRKLVIIPARGGSKGIPGKNIKPLNGKPLILYTIDTARKVAADSFICVSTDDDKIIECVENYGLPILFKRPEQLATDSSGMYGVINHALDFYKLKGFDFDCVILLQPTSPFRKEEHIRSCLELFNRNQDLDMVVTVKDTDSNPYYLFQEKDGYMERLVIAKGLETRQEAMPVYQYNGAVYVINVNSLDKYSSLSEMKYVKKVKMEKLESIDIDEPIDWYFCESLLEKEIVKI